MSPPVFSLTYQEEDTSKSVYDTPSSQWTLSPLVSASSFQDEDNNKPVYEISPLQRSNPLPAALRTPTPPWTPVIPPTFPGLVMPHTSLVHWSLPTGEDSSSGSLLPPEPHTPTPPFTPVLPPPIFPRLVMPYASFVPGSLPTGEDSSSAGTSETDEEDEFVVLEKVEAPSVTAFRASRTQASAWRDTIAGHEAADQIPSFAAGKDC
jgi:hypothetical protein